MRSSAERNLELVKYTVYTRGVKLFCYKGPHLRLAHMMHVNIINCYILKLIVRLDYIYLYIYTDVFIIRTHVSDLF